VISGVAAGAITSSGATITWTTDQASTSQVEYGTTTAYGSLTTANSTLVTSHSQALTGVAAATVYHYRVHSLNAGGTEAISGDFTFTTLAGAPVISGVAAGSITSSGATITWTTDQASTSQVEYGTTTAYGSVTTVNSTLVTSHSQALTGLAAATLYHYRVHSLNAGGTEAISGDFTFTTLAGAPVISGVAVGSITSSGATITWTTDQASTSQVEYGTTTAYGSLTTVNSTLVTSHSQALTGLAAATLYHYRVHSANASGTQAVSGDFTFTTLAPPFAISNVAAGSISSTGATITWSTNQASSSQVEYGTTTAYGSLTTLNSTLVTSHSQPLTGLSLATVYHYRVYSTNTLGVQIVSGDFTFTTHKKH
jgi:purple acid phosphatase-like protein